MKVLTLVSKKMGYCDTSPIRDMQEDMKQPCTKVKKFSFINLELGGGDGRAKVYKFQEPFGSGYIERTFTYTKGQYVPLWVVGVVVVGGFIAYKKFKK